jgi:hypothetical protein
MLQIRHYFERFSFRALTLAAALAATLVAENGRNFAGTFQLQNVIQGTAVQFDLKATIQNVSGAAIQNATVTIASPGIRPMPLQAADFQGSITGVKVAYHKLVTLSGTFTVPLLEYQQWQRGAMPNMIISYTNAAGQQVHDHVELAPVIAPVQ